jgi:hypothetical protein
MSEGSAKLTQGLPAYVFCLFLPTADLAIYSSNHSHYFGTFLLKDFFPQFHSVGQEHVFHSLLKALQNREPQSMTRYFLQILLLTVHIPHELLSLRLRQEKAEMRQGLDVAWRGIGEFRTLKHYSLNWCQ